MTGIFLANQISHKHLSIHATNQENLPKKLVVIPDYIDVLFDGLKSIFSKLGQNGLNSCLFDVTIAITYI